MQGTATTRSVGSGGFLALALRCGAGRALIALSVKLPRWKFSEFVQEVSPLVSKHRFLRCGGLMPLLVLLAGLGGEGEVCRACVAVVRRRLFQGVFPAGDDKLRGRNSSTSLCLMFRAGGFAGVWAADYGQEDAVVVFGHIFDIYPCKLCKPNALNCYYGRRECYIDCCQGQFRGEKERFESDLAHGHTLTVLNLFLNGFIITMPMQVSSDYHQRCARTRCLLIYEEMVVLQLQSGCRIPIPCQAEAVFAFFILFGCIRRRQMRESPMSLPRFSGEDFFDLSSVVHPLDLQLNPQPQRCLPMRLLVEPLALRLVRLQEECLAKKSGDSAHYSSWSVIISYSVFLLREMMDHSLAVVIYSL